MGGSQATRYIHTEFKPNWGLQNGCPVGFSTAGQLLHLKGKTCICLSIMSWKKSICSKAVQSVILTLCSAPTAVLSPSFFFYYQVAPASATGTTGAVGHRWDRGGSIGGSSWWGLCASFLLPCRIKSSTAWILLHGRSSLYWFVSNSTNKGFLDSTLLARFKYGFWLRDKGNREELYKNLDVGAWVFQCRYLRQP